MIGSFSIKKNTDLNSNTNAIDNDNASLSHELAADSVRFN